MAVILRKNHELENIHWALVLKSSILKKTAEKDGDLTVVQMKMVTSPCAIIALLFTRGLFYTLKERIKEHCVGYSMR